MTMNGQIVADFIAAGYMYADRIRGGTLNVGGSETGQGGDGVIQVLDANENEICRFDKNGADIFGRLYTEDSDGFWTEVANGRILGGRTNTIYCEINTRAEVYDEDAGEWVKGIGIITGGVIGFDCGLLSVNGYTGVSGTLRLDDIDEIYFQNGLMVGFAYK